MNTQHPEITIVERLKEHNRLVKLNDFDLIEEILNAGEKDNATTNI